LDGKSYVKVLTGQAREFRDEIYASHSGDGTMNVFPQRGLRDRRYKYVLNLHPERKWTTHFTKTAGIAESHKDVYDTWLEKAKTDNAAAKLIRVTEDHPREELYDTRTDPYELNNLAGRPEQRARLEKMRARMNAIRRELNDPEE
jgi:arylsulfatase A-like enzyme